MSVDGVGVGKMLLDGVGCELTGTRSDKSNTVTTMGTCVHILKIPDMYQMETISDAGSHNRT